MSLLKRNIEWLKSNCPICGKEYEYTANYKPATCGKFSCVQEAHKMGMAKKCAEVNLFQESKKI